MSSPLSFGVCVYVKGRGGSSVGAEDPRAVYQDSLGEVHRQQQEHAHSHSGLRVQAGTTAVRRADPQLHRPETVRTGTVPGGEWEGSEVELLG